MSINTLRLHFLRAGSPYSISTDSAGERFGINCNGTQILLPIYSKDRALQLYHSLVEGYEHDAGTGN